MKEQIIGSREFMELPNEVIELLIKDEFFLVKGGGQGEGVDNSGTGCDCDVSNSGVGCHC